jgi:hypothetical protein
LPLPLSLGPSTPLLTSRPLSQQSRTTKCGDAIYQTCQY